MPKVSVIIPNYNHAPYLEQRIDSVLNQTFQDFELIILDDNSIDESKVIIEQYRNHPKVLNIFYNETNSGSTFKQWQKGIHIAKGEYIWIAESDDWCESNFLNTAVSELIKDENNVLFFCNSIQVNENNILLTENTISYGSDLNPFLWEKNFTMPGKTFIQDVLTYKNLIQNASAVVFKKSAITCDFFKLEQFKMAGDWYFWSNILISGNVCYNALGLNYFRYLSQSTRNHNNRDKIVCRVIEECKVFEYQCDIIIINSKLVYKKEKKILSRWFQIHRIRTVFSDSFYSILNFSFINKNRINLIFHFIYYKLKNKLSL